MLNIFDVWVLLNATPKFQVGGAKISIYMLNYRASRDKIVATK
ncbi:hypothetical protein VCRA2133E348_1460001 [Vibrio crassostreae]|nr:hypothetical protein VCRA2133E348_1460001 [Vibrio crassostreae]CAK3176629.1 hypothetical protein VCRA213O314_1590001 [Vibrio crassostreae]